MAPATAAEPNSTPRRGTLGAPAALAIRPAISALSAAAAGPKALGSRDKPAVRESRLRIAAVNHHVDEFAVFEHRELKRLPICRGVAVHY